MKVAALVALFIVGVLLLVACAAWIFPPASLGVAGVVCVAVALRVEVGDA